VKAGLLEEMQLAKRVTETVMPGREVFEYGPLRIAGSVNPAEHCGGDWWVQAQLDEARLAVGIGDVAGHGLSTALIATSAVSAFSAVLTTHHADNVDAAIVIQALNSTLFHFGKGEYQMSCAVLVFDLLQGELQFANGGHPLPCVYNRNDRQVISLAARGPLLGKSQRLDCTPAQVKLRPGDVLVWYSDGLVECRDAGGQQFGWKRLVSAAQRFGDLPADEMREAILAEARTFSAGHPAEDDVTLIVAEYMPAVEAAPDAPEPQFADDGLAAQDPFAADPQSGGAAEQAEAAPSAQAAARAPFVDVTDEQPAVSSQADTQPLEVPPAANEAPHA
jgi:sigma-B regulation protein RsbU (phosphoserine phosphatase)